MREFELTIRFKISHTRNHDNATPEWVTSLVANFVPGLVAALLLEVLLYLLS